MVSHRWGLRVPALALSLVMLLAAAGTPVGAGGVPSGLDKVHPALIATYEKRPNDLIKVLVTVAPGSGERLETIPGAVVQGEFPFVNAKHLKLPARALSALQQNPNVKWVSPDAPLKLNALLPTQLRTIYNQVANTPPAWNQGITGRGITVAVLDSGVSATGDVSGWYLKMNPDGSDAYDHFGHGTHVAGVVAGFNRFFGYQGVAPEAKIFSIKVSDDKGAGSASDLIKGLEWIYNNHAAYNIRVVNLSVQASQPESYKTSPVAAAVEKLWFSGIVVVVASGNSGADPYAAYYPPSNDPYVISVGATDDNGTIDTADDTLATFSSRGTSQEGYYRPDIVAPGRKIVSNLAAGSAWTTTFPDRIVSGNYIRMSGTSFAAPVVSGAVALLLQQNPALKPDQVKWLLLNSARKYGLQADSASLLDAGAMLSLARQGSIGSANQGLTPSNYITSSDSGTESNIYWDQIYWDQIYWDQIYWDQVAPD